MRRPSWDVRRKRTIERVALEMERAVDAGDSWGPPKPIGGGS